ncbi:MAG: EFR1 family ferrodoxin [Candidatus Omnitrophica bacterium]|nr:EFR1 family ferrodoxin [Candidatus Omnitrophota bacterium]
MNTVIYYFSATGNSLVAAKDLAAWLGNAKLVPMVKALRSGEYEMADAIGIAFPVYMFGIPLIVANFLKNVKVKQSAYVFSLATLGGLPGLAHSQVQEILKKRGIELAAGFSVLMPGNYTPLYEAISKDKQQEMFEKEKIKIKEIAASVRERKKTIMEQKPFLPNFLLNKLLYKPGSKQIPLSGKDFWYTDACTKCGLCARVCPVANIEMRDQRPAWLDHCQHCMACLQWCPVEAIQYKKSTVGRKRYHHPDVSKEEIIVQ